STELSRGLPANCQSTANADAELACGPARYYPLPGSRPSCMIAFLGSARRRTLPTPVVGLVGLWLAALLTGCTPKIGDDCQTSVDCSQQGDRLCDTAQPG